MAQSSLSNSKNSKKRHPVDVHVGKRLRLRRNEHGMSQQKLGQALNKPISFQQIQKYERGINRISSSKLWEFSNALNVSISYFYKGLEENEGVINLDNIKLFNNTEIQNLVKAYYKINDKRKRKYVINLVRGISDAK